MNILNMLSEQLRLTYQETVNAAVQFAPKIVVAIVLILIALVVTKVLQIIIRAFLRRAHLDTLVKRVGVDKALAQFGVNQPLSELLPKLVYYLLLFFFARTLANNLGLAALSGAIDSFFAYLPNVFAAAVVLVVGSTVGQFAGSGVASASEASGLDFGSALGRLVSVTILFVAVLMALAQLKIDTDIIRILMMCGLSGMALAFGLAFGLGTRDIVRNLLAGFYARKVFRAGDDIQVGDHRGNLQAISSTFSVLGNEGGRTVVSNTTLLDNVSRIHD